MWVEIYNRPDARVMCRKTVPPTLCEHGIKMSTDKGAKYFYFCNVHVYGVIISLVFCVLLC